MSAEAESSQPAMLAALEAVKRWREEADAEIASRGRELDSEEDRLKSDIAELQRQLKAIAILREENASRKSALIPELEQRTHSAILEGLRKDSALLAERSALYAEAIAARDERVAAMIAEPGMAERVEAFEQFEQNREATLANLPELYRGIVVEQHEATRAQLTPIFEALSGELPALDVPKAGITLVVSVDPVEGEPEALAVIVPVPFAVYAKWAERPEDLLSIFAYRVVGAVSGMLSRLGEPDVPVQYAPYREGQLAIQVWLADVEIIDELDECFDIELKRLNQLASELRTVGLDVHVTWQPPEVIAPNTDDQED